MRIITYQFGIKDTIPNTLEKLGNIMGYSKERIRQPEDNALLKLKKGAN